MRIKPSYPDIQRLKTDAIEYRKTSMQFLTRMKARFEKQAETDEQTRKDLDQLEGDLLAFDPAFEICLRCVCVEGRRGSIHYAGSDLL